MRSTPRRRRCSRRAGMKERGLVTARWQAPLSCCETTGLGRRDLARAVVARMRERPWVPTSTIMRAAPTRNFSHRANCPSLFGRQAEDHHRTRIGARRASFVQTTGRQHRTDDPESNTPRGYGWRGRGRPSPRGVASRGARAGCQAASVPLNSSSVWPSIRLTASGPRSTCRPIWRSDMADRLGL